MHDLYDHYCEEDSWLEGRRYQWVCSECLGFFTEDPPNVNCDGSILCAKCLDDLVMKHSPEVD